MGIKGNMLDRIFQVWYNTNLIDMKFKGEKLMKKAKCSTLDLAYIAMFSAIIAICSWISVPSAVPFTMQTFGVFLTVGTLGGRRGSISVMIYILLGAIGLPIFSGFSGGMGTVLGARGGYIIGFLLAAIVMWVFECLLGKSKLVIGFSILLGLLICYAFGTLWFTIVYAKGGVGIGTLSALSICVFPYLIPDVVKAVLALTLSEKLRRVCR